MDKLKAQLAAAAPYTFWAMCVGILVVSLASWWMSTSTLKSEQTARLAEIDTQFKSVSQLKKPQHPNQSTIKGMDELNKAFAKEVADGWQKQYDQQAAVLVWPTSFDEEFRKKVDIMRPIESIPGPVTPINFALPVDMLQIYRNYIENDLPTLAKTIGTEWTANSGGAAASEGNFGGAGSGAVAMPMGGGGAGGGATGPIDRSIVLWDSANQQELLDTHFGFTASTELPTTLEVLYAQEDLWVLQNIMDIIKAANDDATARHEAAIKEINFIRLGRTALGLAGQITPVGVASSQSGSGEAAGMPMPGGAGDAAGMGMPATGAGAGAAGAAGSAPAGMPGEGGAMPGMPGAGGAATFTDPADGRYVDEKYMPLQATRLRNALKSRTKEDALLAVAKRVPVRMRFKIDQRRLNRVVAACGNSPLPVEVRQIRVNREAAAATGGGGGSGGAAMGVVDAGAMGMPDAGGAGFGGGMEGFGGFGGAGGGARGMVKGSAVSDATVDPHLVDVELYGIVYIYNPVNKSQLGLDETTTTVMAETAGAPVTPASAPAPTAPAAPAPGTAPAAVIPPAAGAGAVAG